MSKEILILGFSGGRTSAFMGKYISMNKNYSKKYDIIYYFCNTGEEEKETLDFIDKCDKEWNLNVVWLEPVINEYKIGTTHKIVSYESADLTGKPFNEMLDKYPLPNKSAPNCTRELKQRPIESYMRSLGIKNYTTALGIRYDERHRESLNADKNNIIYPLIYDIKVDEPFIRNWWDLQYFDLLLKDYQGNCNLCFKKSLEKQITMIIDLIEANRLHVIFRWIKREEKYSSEKSPRFDLRYNLTVRQKYQMALEVIAGKKKMKRVRDKHELRKEQGTLILDIGIKHGIPKEMMQLGFDCFCKAS